MARPVTITISHQLGIDEARDRIRTGFGKIQTQLTGGMLFKFTENWESNERMIFTAKGLGQSIRGQVDIFPAHIRIEAVLPGLLASIAETISGKVEKESKLLLEKE